MQKLSLSDVQSADAFREEKLIVMNIAVGLFWPNKI